MSYWRLWEVGNFTFQARINSLEILGQGKTQVAIEYCHQCRVDRRYLAIFFLDASSEDALRKGLISLADVLKQPGQIFDNDDHRLRVVLDRIRTWNRNWLLVFDNYDNPKTFQSLERDYIPHSTFGSILVTSRYQELIELGEVISVPPMTPDEAKSLLQKALQLDEPSSIGTEDTDQANEVVKKLGCLPLAVHQAAAFIRRKGLSFTQFIAEYDSLKVNIWSQKPALWTYDGTVYTTWELSYGLIDDDDNGRTRKGAILTMLAFLDFRSISRELFNVPRQLLTLEKSKEGVLDLVEPPWLREMLRNDGAWDLLKIDDLLDDFKDLSLLQISERWHQGAFKISLHPLVAEWIKYRARADRSTEMQCLFQASVLVAACMKALAGSGVSRLLSDQAQQEVLKHQAACLANLDEFRSLGLMSEISSEIEAIFLQPATAETQHQKSDQQQNQPDSEQQENGEPQNKPGDDQQSQPVDQPIHPSDKQQNPGSDELGFRWDHEVLRSRTNFKISHQRETLVEAVQIQRDDRNAQQRTAIIKWLSSEPHDAGYNALRMIEIPNSCDWLFEQSFFQEWETGVSRTLLITGKGRQNRSVSRKVKVANHILAGSGKTVLM